jgi:hypothetical protein
MLVLPAEAHGVHGAALRLGADQLGVPGAVGLAEGVAARDEGDRLLVVHRHLGERHPDVVGGGERVRLALRALRVHVDQAHGDVGQRALELQRVLVPVALVAEPGVLGAPEDLLGLEDVLAAEGEAERLEAHRLEGDVAGEHEQVGPGQLAAVLLLDRPQEAAGLVEVGVVGPAVERGEPLRAVAAAAPAVLDPVRAGLVPGHADEERAVVAVVGGPPVLRVGHHRLEVPLHRLDVERADLGPVVEVGAERVGRLGVLVQHRQVELVRPPVPVGLRPPRPLRLGALDRRVLALAGALGLALLRH